MRKEEVVGEQCCGERKQKAQSPDGGILEDGSTSAPLGRRAKESTNEEQ